MSQFRWRKIIWIAKSNNPYPNAYGLFEHERILCVGVLCPQPEHEKFIEVGTSCSQPYEFGKWT